MRQPKVLRQVTAPHDILDLTGWTIPAGAILHIIKEGPPHPHDGHRVLLVRVDNGTGFVSTMPETVIHDTDLKSKPRYSTQ